MVLLTITPSIVEALAIQESPKSEAVEAHYDDNETNTPSQNEKEPSLDEPKVGNPVSHGQIVNLWKNLKAQGNSSYTLEQLLRGASIYIPPPPPKPEPVSSASFLQAHMAYANSSSPPNIKPSWLVSAAKKKLAPTNE